VVEEDELVAVLTRGYESKDLDYKAPTGWDDSDKKSKCELVKDILAMANTLGGYLVIGVAESPAGFSFDGLTEKQAKSYDSTKINGFLQNYADPPINTKVRKLTRDGKTFVVLEVPRFSDTPHLCQKDFPGALTDRTLYVRTDNNESAAVKTSADFRVVIEQAVRNRRDAMLAAMRSVLVSGSSSAIGVGQATEQAYQAQLDAAQSEFKTNNPLPNKAYDYFFECSFRPEPFIEERFSLPELRAAAFEATVDYTGWPFLFIHNNRPDVLTSIQDGIQTLIYSNDSLFGTLLDFWRFYQSGLFYKKELPRGSEDSAIAVFPYIVQYFAKAIDCLTRLYEKRLDPADTISLQVSITGTQGRRLVNDNRGTPFFSNYTCQIPSVQVKQRHSLAEWKAGIEDHAVEMISEVQLRFNWNPPSTEFARQRIKQMFARAF
jgi:hypothetical protein